MEETKTSLQGERQTTDELKIISGYVRENQEEEEEMLWSFFNPKKIYIYIF